MGETFAAGKAAAVVNAAAEASDINTNSTPRRPRVEAGLKLSISLRELAKESVMDIANNPFANKPRPNDQG